MDEIVIRGMLKWPNVPAVYGWLSLDRRGSWMIKNVSGRFERIANAAVNDFIGRNYAVDEEGRWYFQNGPQRVFVALDYTPWVYRLDDSGEGLLARARGGFILRLMIDRRYQRQGYGRAAMVIRQHHSAWRQSQRGCTVQRNA